MAAATGDEDSTKDRELAAKHMTTAQIAKATDCQSPGACRALC